MTWNKNDLESSKPNWLTEEQKRQCFRTVRGWEIPLAGYGSTSTAIDVFGRTATGASGNLLRAPNYVGPTELLVAIPLDNTVAGASHADKAGVYFGESRGSVSNYGLTGIGDTPNYKPYFTAPVSTVSGLTGSTVFVTKSVTAYIPVIVSDANMTDCPTEMVITLTSSSGTTPLTGVSLITGFTTGTFETLYNIVGATPGSVAITGSALAARQTLIYNQNTQVSGMTSVAAMWDYSGATTYVGNRFGGWGGITAGAAVLRIGSTAITGDYPLRLVVNDGRGGTFGATGTVDFTLTVTSGTSY